MFKVRFDPDSKQFIAADNRLLRQVLSDAIRNVQYPSNWGYDDNDNIIIPIKWYYCQALLGQVEDKTVISIIDTVMDMTKNTKIVTLNEDNDLVLECVPGWLESAYFNFRRVVVRGLYATKTDGGLKVRKGYWTPSEVSMLAEEYGFNVDSTVTSSEYYQDMAQSKMRQDNMLTLARKGSPIEGDDVLLGKIASLDMGEIELFPHQVAALQHAAWTKAEGHNGVILADNVGLGKTITALAIDKFRAGDGSLLIIPPKNTVDNWLNELQLVHGELKVVSVDDEDTLNLLHSLDHASRLMVMKRVVLIIKGKTELNSLEELAPYAFATILPHSVCANWPSVIKVISQMRTIIVDETHKFKGFTSSARGKLLNAMSYAISSEWRRDNPITTIALTATPMVKEVRDMFPIFRLTLDEYKVPFLWSDKREGDRFVKRFKNYPAGIYEVYAPFMVRRNHSAVPEMPVTDMKSGICQLPSNKLAIYNKVVEKLQEYLNERFPTQVPMLAWYTYMRMITGKVKASIIIPAVRQAMDATPGKTVIVAHHRPVLKQLGAAFDAPVIDGDTPFEKRTEWLERFNNGDLNVLVSGLETAVGWNAHAKQIIIAELPWNYSSLSQAIGRIQRLSNPNKELVALLSAAQDTFEESVLLPLIEKKRVREQNIMNGIDYDEDDSFMTDIIVDAFPGITFGDGNVSTADNEDIINFIEQLFAEEDDESQETDNSPIEFHLTDSVGRTEFAAFDSEIGAVMTTTDGKLLVLAHGAADGSVSPANEALISGLPNPLVICCYPARVAKKYGWNTVGGWDGISLFSYDGRRTLTVKPKE